MTDPKSNALTLRPHSDLVAALKVKADEIQDEVDRAIRAGDYSAAYREDKLTEAGSCDVHAREGTRRAGRSERRCCAAPCARR